MISDAIEDVLQGGVPVAGLIAPLSARGNVGYIGLDNWKLGRTAAWSMDRLIHEPGKIGILLGNHRYRNQELCESGFRSYFREHNRDFTLLEPQATHESAAVARELTEQMLADHPDLCGLFVAGGGITGVMSVLREATLRPDFVTVGRELFDATRKALIDGTLTIVMSHPLERLAEATIEAMVRAKLAGPDAGAPSVPMGFDIVTSENV